MPAIGTVDSASGRASVIRGSRLLEVGVGLKLTEGDVVITGETGRVTLRMNEGTRFGLGNSTEITLQQWRNEGVTVLAGSGTVSVDPGRHARRESATFTITTPFADILPARGRFVFTQQGDELQVMMLEAGSLLVQNPGGEITLTGKDQVAAAGFTGAPRLTDSFSPDLSSGR